MFIETESTSLSPKRSTSSQHDSVSLIRGSWVESFSLGNDEFIQRIDICLRAGDDDIGIGTVTTEDARVRDFALSVHGLIAIVLRLNANGDFAERIDAFSNRVDVELEQRF